jgi:hypothetical protein
MSSGLLFNYAYLLTTNALFYMIYYLLIIDYVVHLY